MHELLKDAAAVLIVLKLVETGACRRKQNDIARSRGVRGGLYGPLDRSSLFDSDTTGNLLLDFAGCGANQKSEDGLLTQRRLQQRIVAAFVLAAQYDQDTARKSVER